MNNFYKRANFSPITQLSKPNFKWSLSFCIVFMLFLFSNSALAQPSSFSISGCSVPGADGNYTLDATNPINSCPCYDHESNGKSVQYSGAWILDKTPCSAGPYADIPLYHGFDCDISTATALICDPNTTLSLSGTSTQSIPTLSEWGLIILALLLLTLGTLYLVQPQVRNSFEQE